MFYSVLAKIDDKVSPVYLYIGLLGNAIMEDELKI